MVVPRATVVEYFAWLAREGLEREASFVWNALAIESARIEAMAAFPELRRAYNQRLIEQDIIHPSELDDVDASLLAEILDDEQDHNPPIDDVAQATSWWACFE